MSDSHLFVVLGDIRRLKSDAWMLPTDRRVKPRPSWQVDGLMDQVELLRQGSFGQGRVSVAAWPHWPESSPLPVATAVPLNGVVHAEDIADGIRSFIRLGAVEARSPGRRSVATRAQPLLALPFFGTGGGGGALVRGKVLEQILTIASAAGRENAADIVLVLDDARSYALAQALRRNGTNRFWGDQLSSEKLAEVNRLALLAKRGKLVPFMGAGIGVSAGAPDWGTLIEQLAAGVVLTPSERAALKQPERDALDSAAFLRAAYIERKDTSQNSDGGFADMIANSVDLPEYGLAPLFLANLESEQAITLNYDTLFERASEDSGAVRKVIPGGENADSDKWLLKLHGSVEDVQTIVLTRDDYLGYDSTRAALSSIVKALLVTHHLLFVGFGLADDHFHQIIHDVRRALPKNHDVGAELATALMLHPDALAETLWKGNLRLVTMADASIDARAASRNLEIFLDAVLAFANDGHSYLLSVGYQNEAHPADVALRNSLTAFVDTVDDDARTSDSWKIVNSMLENLGYRPDEVLDPRTASTPGAQGTT